MAALRHPMSGAVYRVRDDGLVDVENNGMTGIFHFDGRYQSGELRVACPHMLLWLAGPQLPATAQLNRRLVKPGELPKQPEAGYERDT